MTDPLSGLIGAVRLTGGVFLDVRLTSPWCVRSRIEAADCHPHLRNPVELIGYHVVLDGRMLARAGEGPAVEVAAGEIVLVPRNEAHVLASAPGLPPVDARALVQPALEGGLARIDHGGGGEPTRMICGFLGSDEARHPLLASLPSLLKLDVREIAARDWIESSARFAVSGTASGPDGPAGTVARLAELLLSEAIRRHLESEGDAGAGRLRAGSDPQIARALGLIHRHMAGEWSIEDLAREAGMSRSAFVARFTALVGDPPMRYATLCRLRTARSRLEGGHAPIALVAHSVGYQSEEAFSRAFKREFGVSPARWRATARG